jgi:predicted nucleotidyltransferase
MDELADIMIYFRDFMESDVKNLSLEQIWLLDTENNRIFAEKQWNKSDSPNGSITTFKLNGRALIKDRRLEEILDTVIEHHPTWRRLHVMGSEITDDEIAQIVDERGWNWTRIAIDGLTFEK